MIRILPSFAAALAACAPSAQEPGMHSQSQDQGSTPGNSSEAKTDASARAEDSTRERDGTQGRAALAPVPEPVSAAENPVPASPAESLAEAQGRRTLSTAFVMVGPDGNLTVELRNGQVLVLRDVVMHRKNYCGVRVPGGRADAQYCGGYAEVAAARPGGPPSPAEPDLAAPNPLASPSKPTKGN